MNTFPITQKLFVSSSNTDYQLNGSKKSWFRFPFVFRHRGSDIFSHMTLKIIHAEIPISFYLIDQNVGYNTVTVNNNIYTIPDGNYTATELVSWWTSNVYPTELVTMQIASKTGVFSFTKGSSFTLSATAYKIFGLESDTTYSGTSITAPYIADLYGSRRLYICMPNIVLDNKDNDLGIGSMLVAIQKNSSPFQIINYIDESNSASLILSDIKTIQDALEIQIRNEYGLVDFNGVDWNMTFEFCFYFDKSLHDKQTSLVQQQFIAPTDENII